MSNLKQVLRQQIQAEVQPFLDKLNAYWEAPTESGLAAMGRDFMNELDDALNTAVQQTCDKLAETSCIAVEGVHFLKATEEQEDDIYDDEMDRAET